MSHESNQENSLEILQDAITNAAKEIEEEFNGTSGNSWFACVRSQLFAISMNLELALEDGLISEEVASQGKKKLDSIIASIHKLSHRYREKDQDVPVEIKQEIIESLDILK